MKKATNKLMSFLAAFAMVIGVLVAPFTSANAADATYENSTNTINIHKILFKNNTQYDGFKPEDKKTSEPITDIKNWFGDSAEEIADVAYDIYVEEDATETNVSNAEDLNAQFNTTEFQADKFYKIVNDTAITKIDGENKGTGNIELEDGSYVIVENVERTTYHDPETGATVSRQGKAIPVRITLPAALPKSNTTGVLHLYPKNTTVDSPDVEKNFTDKINIADANDQTKQDAKEKEENYRVEGVGREVPYTVETVFKTNTTYEHAYWNDQMTEGLTFTQEHLDALRVYVNGVDKTDSFVKTLDEKANGFKLELDDMSLVNEKKTNTTVRIEYTATMNEDSIVDIPESNDVTFHYGNNPSRGNTPVHTKPENGTIDFTKTWADKTPVDGDKATFELRDAQTGEVIRTVSVVMQDGSTNVTVSPDNTDDGITFKDNSPADAQEVTLPNGKTTNATQWNFVFEGLDSEREYKIVETETAGTTAEYLNPATGKIEIVNWNENNPQPKNPKEPKVVRYGKKFVKVDELTDERLENAEFVVTDNAGKYLVRKSEDEVANEKTAYTNAVNAYDAVYKNPEGTQDQLDSLYSEVEKAAEALNNPYKWEAATDKAAAVKLKDVVTLKSDDQGKFEITDLQEGTYYLEETVAPDGYAVREDKVEFTVGKGTYAEDSVKPIDYEAKTGKKDALRVDNRSLTIPQTGGIGSLIFIVAGLALMGVAFVAMKRRNSYEEA